MPTTRPRPAPRSRTCASGSSPIRSSRTPQSRSSPPAVDATAIRRRSDAAPGARLPSRRRERWGGAIQSLKGTRVSDQPQQQGRLRYRLPIELLLLVFAGAWLSRRVLGVATAPPAGVVAVPECVEAMGNLGRMVGVPQTGSEASR